MRVALLIALALVFLLPGPATATVTCSVTDDGGGQITINAGTDLAFVSISVSLTNAVFVAGDCAPGLTSCFMSYAQEIPGNPSSARLNMWDGPVDPTFCGPYTNADGLPVELIEFSVE